MFGMLGNTFGWCILECDVICQSKLFMTLPEMTTCGLQLVTLDESQMKSYNLIKAVQEYRCIDKLCESIIIN